MTTMQVGTSEALRPRWFAIARTSAVLIASLALTAGVMTGLSVVVDTWSK